MGRARPLLGADLALAYGLAHGETVTSIVSFAGTGVQNDRDWHAAYAARLSEEPHGVYQQSPDVQRRLIEDWRRFIKKADLLARIAALQMPITFLHSANDIRPGWPAQQLAYLVPRGSYLELANAPHEAWLTHHDALARALAEILHAGRTTQSEERARPEGRGQCRLPVSPRATRDRG